MECSSIVKLKAQFLELIKIAIEFPIDDETSFYKLPIEYIRLNQSTNEPSDSEIFFIELKNC